MGHPRNSGQGEEKRGEASDGPFKLSPELMAQFEEIESLSPDDPSYAEQIRAVLAEGTEVLRAQGLDLMEI